MPSGVGCRSSCSTENDGALALSSLTRCLSTSRSFTTANVAIRRSVCSHPSSSKLDIVSQRRQHESNYPALPNPGQPSPVLWEDGAHVRQRGCEQPLIREDFCCVTFEERGPVQEPPTSARRASAQDVSCEATGWESVVRRCRAPAATYQRLRHVERHPHGCAGLARRLHRLAVL